MPAYVYHLLHLLGIIMLFTSYGALIARSWTGSQDRRLRTLGSVTAGIALLIVLISAFGLQARLGITLDQGWFWVKFVIWIILGVMLMWINRRPASAPMLFWVTIMLGFINIFMVYVRPF